MFWSLFYINSMYFDILIYWKFGMNNLQVTLFDFVFSQFCVFGFVFVFCFFLFVSLVLLTNKQ